MGVQLKKTVSELSVTQTKTKNPSVCVCECELTAQGSRRSWSATSGQDGLTFQEFPNSSAVDSTIPCRVVKSFSVSPSKLPHRPPTRPRRWAAKRTYTRIPGRRNASCKQQLWDRVFKQGTDTMATTYTNVVVNTDHFDRLQSL